MSKVIALCGSLRRASYNGALLRHAVGMAPAGCDIEIESIREIPLYDADLDAQGTPAPVAALKAKIAAADGLLLATPEYNYSLPGVLKNAIDWLSRPAKDIAQVFGGRAVGVIGAGGASGTRFAQVAWLPVFRGLMMVPYFGRALHVSGPHKVFDAEGNLVDDQIRTQLHDYVTGFATFVAHNHHR
jgi:chromate reductase